VNTAEDPGERANLGVTQTAYEAWVKHPVGERIMRDLTVDHVRALYKAQYWDVVKGDQLPAGIDLCVFDFAVDASPRRAARYLQRLLSTTPDGIIGPVTLAKLREYIRKNGARGTINAYQASRAAYCQQVSKTSTLERVEDVRKAATRMAAPSPADVKEIA